MGGRSAGGPRTLPPLTWEAARGRLKASSEAEPLDGPVRYRSPVRSMRCLVSEDVSSYEKEGLLAANEGL